MSEDANAPLRQISADEFVLRLHGTATQPDAAFAFFLGAGCSLSCQIPGTAELVDRWLKKLHELKGPANSGTSFDDWVRESVPDWDPQNPGSSYGNVIQELFLTAEERQREIDSLCTGKLPRFGYAVLAALMSDQQKYSGRFNVVLTTNFDDLLQDALIRFDRPKPLVIHHDALAGYIRPTRTRPLIVKVHGDHTLSPKNTLPETALLKETIQQKVHGLLHDRGLIFIGYGGNDQSILHLLDGLPEEALPFGVFWVSGSEPRGIILQWLRNREAVWVQYYDFDMLMDKLLRRFEKDIKPNPVYQELIKDLFDAYEKMDEVHRAQLCGKATGEVLKNTDPVFFEHLATYADFLQDDYAKEYATADFYYKAITRENNKDAYVLGNYADFLERRLKDVARAEEYYLKAIEADPHEYRNLNNYAGFLEQRKDYDGAKVFYGRAADAVDPIKDPQQATRLWFKVYTLEVSEDRLAALTHLKKMINDGGNVPTSFELDTVWAKRNRHPGAVWLDKLAGVATGELKPSVLNKWKEWRDA